MSIITLTTDFGLKDHTVGTIKGKIFSLYPNCRVVDISHQIDCFNVSEAAYCIKNSYRHFPKKTVHIIGVDTELSYPDSKHLVVEFDQYYFICADNGVLNLLFTEFAPKSIYQITIHDRMNNNPSDMDVFIESAVHLAKGGVPNVIGKKIKQLNQIKPIQAQFEKNLIKGHIIYIDHFGNCVSNITKKKFDNYVGNRAIKIKIAGKTLDRIQATYCDFPLKKPEQLRYYEGDLLALFNENDHLEIALYKSNPRTTGAASTLLGISYLDSLIVEINEI